MGVRNVGRQHQAEHVDWSGLSDDVIWRIAVFDGFKCHKQLHSPQLCKPMPPPTTGCLKDPCKLDKHIIMKSSAPYSPLRTFDKSLDPNLLNNNAINQAISCESGLHAMKSSTTPPKDRPAGFQTSSNANVQQQPRKSQEGSWVNAILLQYGSAE